MNSSAPVKRNPALARVQRDDSSSGTRKRSNSLRVLQSLAKNEPKLFNKKELDEWYNIFKSKRSEGCSELKKDEFRSFMLEMGMANTLVDRIFSVFDKTNSNTINLEEFLRGYRIMLNGTFSEKIRFCFDCYDSGGKGWISLMDAFDLVHSSMNFTGLTLQDFDEASMSNHVGHLGDTSFLVKQVMSKLDRNKDGKIRFEDYEAVVREEPMLMEALCPIFPQLEPENPRPKKQTSRLFRKK